ncbi:MAG: peptide ABC transporter substrate-binding protein [Gemmatimonadaceae bacterium]
MPFIRFQSGLSAALLGATALGLVSCQGGETRGGSTGADGGTVIVAAPAEAETLLPPLVTSIAAKQIVDQLFDFLADIGPNLNTVGDAGFTPRLADSWKWSADSSAVTFHINPKARWHDGKPVTGADVAFSYDLTADPVLESFVRTNLPAIDSVRVPDSSSVTFYYKKKAPERFFQLVYNLWILPKHLLESLDRKQLASSAFARNPVGSGPFKFVRWEPRGAIELVANTDYPLGRPHLDRVVFAYSSDLGTAANRVAAGEADMVELVRPETQDVLVKSGKVRIMRYGGWDGFYFAFNLRNPKNRAAPHPILSQLGVRQAIALSLDRPAAVKNVFDTLATMIEGPFVHSHFTADSSLHQLPHDSVRAMAILDSLGWKDTNGDGIRDKGGQPLRLEVIAPSTSLARRRLAVILQEQCKKVGIDVAIRELEPAAVQKATDGGAFDIVVNGWHFDPSPASVSQAWGSFDLNTNSNIGRYKNPHADSLMQRVVEEPNPAKVRQMYSEIYHTIVSDVPAVFLYELTGNAGINTRIQVPSLRSDAWWATLSQWSIPPAQRIDRDKVGLPAKSN